MTKHPHLDADYYHGAPPEQPVEPTVDEGDQVGEQAPVEPTATPARRARAKTSE